MIYEVTKPKDSEDCSDVWQVEAIDRDSEGECYVTIFYGLKAEERAEEYAAWKNGQLSPSEYARGPGKAIVKLKAEAQQLLDTLDRLQRYERPATQA